jgi:hypothetical protein
MRSYFCSCTLQVQGLFPEEVLLLDRIESESRIAGRAHGSRCESTCSKAGIGRNRGNTRCNQPLELD